MSTAEADLLPFDERSARPARPERGLRAVAAPARRRRPRLVYGIAAVATIGAIAIAQLGMSILSAQSSYELAALENQQRQLTLDRQELTDDLAGLSSPQYLAANASALGMVVGSSPTYLRLSDAKVSGSGQAAGAQSTVNVGAGNAAANSLIADRPLVTDADSTIGELTEQDVPETVTDAPPIDGGLPSPKTH